MSVLNRTPDEGSTNMIELADLAYGDAPYKEVEIAHKHVLDVISQNEAGFQPVLTRWPTFPRCYLVLYADASATAFSGL